MITTLTRTQAAEIERYGEKLMCLAEDLVGCRSMSNWDIAIHEIEAIEMDPKFRQLWGTRFQDLLDELIDLTIGGDDFNGTMQRIEDASACLRCRSPRTPWSKRDD